MKRIFLFFSFVLPTLLFPQDELAMLNVALEEDSATATAIALYPERMRTSAFSAAGYPEALVRIERLRDHTRSEYLQILSACDESDQEKLRKLCRHPGLVAVLRKAAAKEEVEKLVAAYPAPVQQAALHCWQKHSAVLEQVHTMEKEAEASFRNRLKDYPEAVQRALEELAGQPELLDLLNANLRTVTLIGYVYKMDHALVRDRFIAIAARAERDNQRALESWRKALAKDPDAWEEFQASARLYSKARGYSDDEMAAGTREGGELQRSCPYWSGYASPCWQDWGYYYGPEGPIWFSFPSQEFANWYFANNKHFYYFPHFSDLCFNTYFNYYGAAVSLHSAISNWIEANKVILPANLLLGDSERPRRLREFGKGSP